VDPETFQLNRPLPREAGPALQVAGRLRESGHTAVLAGGCVRDLLLGGVPSDYDVATDARPDDVCRLFRATRKVGAQFGVVLVRQGWRWIEVATFRSDGVYSDGRHPDQVTFSTPEGDARRRDFTINGMFLDPAQGRVIDYVGGRLDLAERRLRAIGEPAERFGEDHLRMLRAVRFAARLDFTIEPATLAAVRAAVACLERVSAERVRDELERMLSHPSRCAAFDLLATTGLIRHLWPRADWSSEQAALARTRLGRTEQDAPFELAAALLLADRPLPAVHDICRALTCSNQQRETIAWLVLRQADLDDPESVSLASLKKLMAHPAFELLARMSRAVCEPDIAGERWRALRHRLDAIRPETVQPAPLVSGDDLIARQVAAGPIYAEVLDRLYTEQLDEKLTTRAAALRRLDDLLSEPR
jgi:poly(A) polymerase